MPGRRAASLIGVVAPAWVVAGARGASVERRLQAERVIEDEPLEATIEVRRGPLGPAGRPSCSIRSPGRAELGGPAVAAPGGRWPTSGSSPASRAGACSGCAPPSLLVHDPLELARVERAGAGAAQELLVLPRTEPVRWLAGRAAGGRSARGRSPAEALAAVDLDGLRPYRPGTPASRIHWPALARGAGLLERRLRADGDTRPLVVLDAARPGAPDDQLDAAVRAAASLTLELARGAAAGCCCRGERRATAIEPDLARLAGRARPAGAGRGRPGRRRPPLRTARRGSARCSTSPRAARADAAGCARGRRRRCARWSCRRRLGDGSAAGVRGPMRRR